MTEPMNLNVPMPMSLAYGMQHQHSQASPNSNLGYMVGSNADNAYLFANSGLQMNSRSSSTNESIEYPFTYNQLFSQNMGYDDTKTNKAAMNELALEYLKNQNQAQYSQMYDMKQDLSQIFTDQTNLYRTPDETDSQSMSLHPECNSNGSPTEANLNTYSNKLTLPYAAPKSDNSPQNFPNEFNQYHQNTQTQLDMSAQIPTQPLTTSNITSAAPSNANAKMGMYSNYNSYNPYYNPYQMQRSLQLQNYGQAIQSQQQHPMNPYNGNLNPVQMGMLNPSMFDLYNYNANSKKIYSFVTMNTTKHKKRFRRKFEEIERIYQCNYKHCTKSYGTLNNLNAHILMQKHGQKRSAFEFKDLAATNVSAKRC